MKGDNNRSSCSQEGLLVAQHIGYSQFIIQYIGYSQIIIQSDCSKVVETMKQRW